MYKKTTNLFTKVLLGCCLLATYSIVWAGPKEELAENVTEKLMERTISFKKAYPVWDQAQKWVEVKDGSWQVSENCADEIKKFSDSLTSMVFQKPAAFDLMMGGAEDAFAKLSGSKVVPEAQYALLMGLAFMPQGTPFASLTKYDDQALQATFFASELRFLISFFEDDIYKPLYAYIYKVDGGEGERKPGREFLERLQRRLDPNAKPEPELPRGVGLEVRSIYESIAAFSRMRITEFKPDPQQGPVLNFPAPVDTVADQLWPVMSKLDTQENIDKNPLSALVTLAGPLPKLPEGFTKKHLADFLKSYCAGGGDMIESLEDLLKLGSCTGRDTKTLSRLALLYVYLREPVPLAKPVSQFGRAMLCNDVQTIYTSAEQGTPLYEASEGEKFKVASENLKKGREFRAERRGKKPSDTASAQ